MVYLAKCSWCNKFLGIDQDKRRRILGKRVLISHKICGRCRDACREEGVRIHQRLQIVNEEMGR